MIRVDGTRVFAGISYGLISGYRPLQLDVWVPAVSTPPPLVVWIHGGAWLSGDRRYLPETLRPNQLFDALLGVGLAVASVDYRHARETPFPAQLHDVKAALRYLRLHATELRVDVTRVGVWGESAGGHLAALLALTADRDDLEGDVGVPGSAGGVDAVVDWYGVADPDALPRMSPPAAELMQLPEHPQDLLLAGAGPATRADAAPLRQVHPGAPPFLLLHGASDRRVRPMNSEHLAAKLRARHEPVTLEIVPDTSHIGLLNGFVSPRFSPTLDDTVRWINAPGPQVR